MWKKKIAPVNSILLLPASLFSCCVCVVNVRRRALLLVLLCKCGTLHAKAVTELLRKQHITQLEKREAEQNRRLLQKTTLERNLRNLTGCFDFWTFWLFGGRSAWKREKKMRDYFGGSFQTWTSSPIFRLRIWMCRIGNILNVGFFPRMREESPTAV